MCGPATTAACGRSTPRRCRTGPARTAAIWCRRRRKRDRKRLAALVARIRALATSAVSSAVLKSRSWSAGAATGWVAETAARPQTKSPQLSEPTFRQWKALCNAGGDPDTARRCRGGSRQWIGAKSRPSSAGRRGVRDRRRVNKPKGFLGYTAVDEARWATATRLVVRRSPARQPLRQTDRSSMR